MNVISNRVRDLHLIRFPKDLSYPFIMRIVSGVPPFLLYRILLLSVVEMTIYSGFLDTPLRFVFLNMTTGLFLSFRPAREISQEKHHLFWGILNLLMGFLSCIDNQGTSLPDRQAGFERTNVLIL